MVVRLKWTDEEGTAEEENDETFLFCYRAISEYEP